VLLSFIWIIFNSITFVIKPEDAYIFVDYKFGGLNDIFFGNHFYYDSINYAGRILILFITSIYLLSIRNEIYIDKRLQKVEFLILILLGLFFSMLMISSSSLFSLFLAIEGVVMVMYILAANGTLSSVYPLSKIIRYRSTEGSLKYIILNAIASSFFLLGILLVVLFGDGNIYFETLYSNLLTETSPFVLFGVLLGLIFIALTFLFKIGAVPFHAWMADLYESATPGVLFFFLLIPKIAILFTFLNLYRFLFTHFSLTFFTLFIFAGVTSLVIGAILASRQTKINRILAYSSISQTGALLILFAIAQLTNNDKIITIISLFIFSYALLMLHFALSYTSIRQSTLKTPLDSLKSLPFVQTIPTSAQSMFALFIFNLSGVPPFLGWILKALVVLGCTSAAFLLFSTDAFYDLGAQFGFKNISHLELLLLSLFNINIENFILIFSLCATCFIFISLVVSAHYSIQLYKSAFTEFNNFTSKDLALGFSSISACISSLLLMTLIINLFGFTLVFFYIYILF